jgi:hypothetical protein
MKSTFRRATSLNEAELRALWRMRLGLINLKPSVSEEQDFAAFAQDFQWPGYVWILQDQERILGFFLQRGMPVLWQHRRLFCLLPEYGFIAPELRGHPSLPLASLAITLLTLARHPLLPAYVAASTYPPGYIAFRRTVRPFWTLQATDLPAWERGLLLHLGALVARDRFRPEDGTVTMRTIPIVAREDGAAGHADSRRFYQDYVAANPEWKQGRGLFFVFPLNARVLSRVALHSVERLWQRWFVSPQS